MWIKGYAVAQLVEVLRYKPKRREFDSLWDNLDFPLA
jgi:hypothetical protein